MWFDIVTTTGYLMPIEAESFEAALIQFRKLFPDNEIRLILCR